MTLVGVSRTRGLIGCAGLLVRDEVEPISGAEGSKVPRAEIISSPGVEGFLALEVGMRLGLGHGGEGGSQVEAKRGLGWR